MPGKQAWVPISCPGPVCTSGPNCPWHPRKTILCMYCATRRPWPESFPNRDYAMCSDCVPDPTPLSTRILSALRSAIRRPMSGCDAECGYLTDDGFCIRHAGCVREPKAPERCPSCLGAGYIETSRGPVECGCTADRGR